MELVKFVLSGFWVWLGFMIMAGSVLRSICFVWNRFMRHLNVRSKGVAARAFGC